MAGISTRHPGSGSFYFRWKETLIDIFSLDTKRSEWIPNAEGRGYRVGPMCSGSLCQIVGNVVDHGDNKARTQGRPQSYNSK